MRQDKRASSAPLILLQTLANRQLIVACSNAAAKVGIRVGMTLAQARALCAEVSYADWRPDEDQKTLEALGRYLTRFTPVVATGTQDASDLDSPPSIHNPQSTLFLDLTGCEHLFGGGEIMIRRIAQALRGLRIPAFLASAPTPGAAYALTWSPGLKLLSLPTQPRIDDVPLSGLRLPEEVLASLHHLGLETIGQLRSIPRDQLPARFGRALNQRLDQLSGRLPEPLTPLPVPITLQSHFDFDGSVADPQVLEMTFQQLLSPLLLQLERRGEGIRELEITCHCDPWNKQKQQTLVQNLSISRPTRNARSLLNLYRCAHDQMIQAAQVSAQVARSRSKRTSRNFDSGFTAMTLRVMRFQALPHEQVQMYQADNSGRERAWQATLDLIRTRLGNQSLQQVELKESYLPEKAYERRPAAMEAEIQEAAAIKEMGDRPLQLQPPVELAVMVSPSREADGTPLRFNLSGEVHTVRHAIGPERIAGQWWEGHDRTRDYFDVTDTTGRRYWMFKVQESGKWYLHGTY